MENTPLAPRQRNRRSDRQASPEPMQQGYVPQQQAPAQPMAPAQPVQAMPQQIPVRLLPLQRNKTGGRCQMRH